MVNYATILPNSFFSNSLSSVSRSQWAWPATSNIHAGGLLPLLDSGCHHSSCLTCISTTLQSRSEVHQHLDTSSSANCEDAGQELESHLPILEWPNVRFPEKNLKSLSLFRILSNAKVSRIMPNCWLSSRVSIAVASLCFTIPRILRGHKYAVPQLENSSKRSIIIRGQFINWSSKAGTKSLKGVCLLVITTSGSGQSLRWKPPKTWTSCHDQISSQCWKVNKNVSNTIQSGEQSELFILPNLT